MMKKKKYDIEWLGSEIKKDELEINSYKKELIQSIKNVNKEDLFKEKKVSIWTKIRRTLGF